MNNKILFPSKTRIVAFVLIIATILLSVAFQNFIDLDQHSIYRPFFKNLSMGLFCLALFFIQFSKYKEDDEMLLDIRLKLILQSFITAILYLIISPFVDLLIFNGDIVEIPALKIIMFMLLYQIIMFQMKRYSLKKELAKE